MDKRQQKSRKAIFEAFSVLLSRKSYDHITVQEIIDLANIGRSTFYAHFETKDELLHAMCEQIFGHIFSEVASAEQHHDFSNADRTLPAKLTHLLYHLKEQQGDIVSLLSGESSDIFLRYFKGYLEQLFSEYETGVDARIPGDFIANHYASSFAEAVKWWVKENMEAEPEKIVAYYAALSNLTVPSAE